MSTALLPILAQELKEGIVKRMRLYLETQIKKNDTEIVKLGDITNRERGERKQTPIYIHHT